MSNQEQESGPQINLDIPPPTPCVSPPRDDAQNQADLIQYGIPMTPYLQTREIGDEDEENSSANHARSSEVQEGTMMPPPPPSHVVHHRPQPPPPLTRPGLVSQAHQLPHNMMYSNQQRLPIATPQRPIANPQRYRLQGTPGPPGRGPYRGIYPITTSSAVAPQPQMTTHAAAQFSMNNQVYAGIPQRSVAPHSTYYPHGTSNVNSMLARGQMPVNARQQLVQGPPQVPGH